MKIFGDTQLAYPNRGGEKGKKLDMAGDGMVFRARQKVSSNVCLPTEDYGLT